MKIHTPTHLKAQGLLTGEYSVASKVAQGLKIFFRLLTFHRLLISRQLLVEASFFKIFAVPGPFCGATDCPYFGLHVTLPMGFKVRVVLSPVHLLSCVW